MSRIAAILLAAELALLGGRIAVRILAVCVVVLVLLVWKLRSFFRRSLHHDRMNRCLVFQSMPSHIKDVVVLWWEEFRDILMLYPKNRRSDHRSTLIG